MNNYLKKGDKVYCIRTKYNVVTNKNIYEKGRTYNVQNIDNYTITITGERESLSKWGGMGGYTFDLFEDKDEYGFFGNFFVDLKENRRLKLKKLINKNKL